MLKDRLVALLNERAEFLRESDVLELRLFGSVARGEERDDSDIDVLVRFTSPPTFDNYMNLKFMLEDALGRRVDLVTFDGLREEIREEVLAEALRVA